MTRGDSDVDGALHAMRIPSRQPERSNTDHRRHDDEHNRTQPVHQLGVPKAAQAAPECGAQREPRGSYGNDLSSHDSDPGRQFEQADFGRQQQERKDGRLGVEQCCEQDRPKRYR